MNRSHSNVLPKVSPKTEEDFRNEWLAALARLCSTHGEAQVALWLGVGVKHLRVNIRSGISLPTADKIWNLLAYDESAHDELDKLYGLKKVSESSVCSNDPLTVDIIGLAHETAEDEAPDSPGGIRTTEHELREKDEARLRRVHRRIGHWLDLLEALRTGRSKVTPLRKLGPSTQARA